MNNFKFRAECLHDVVELLKKMTSINSITIDRIGMIDVEVTIKTVLNKREVIRYMEDVFDAHVMIQTIQEADKYTGERN